ncbi:hypothetical protein EWB00_002273 [Schistosoma japonicum]|uniref:Uncharacterized protein n=1 Tax=Schistosoma japonicum TaxID=6182 RepID=A0A4Z2DCW0_SCHJA|nr:hypothetical protein EWB00_002273 [Schistosoma japonicum]
MNNNVRKEGISLKTLTSLKCFKTSFNIKVTDIRVAEVAKLIDPIYGYQVSTIKNSRPVDCKNQITKQLLIILQFTCSFSHHNTDDNTDATAVAAADDNDDDDHINEHQLLYSKVTSELTVVTKYCKSAFMNNKIYRELGQHQLHHIQKQHSSVHTSQ